MPPSKFLLLEELVSTQVSILIFILFYFLSNFIEESVGYIILLRWAN